MTHVFAPTNPARSASSSGATAASRRVEKILVEAADGVQPAVAALADRCRLQESTFANDAEKAKKSAESVGDGVKKAAEDTAKGAKGWWDKEVVGAKKAMDRKAGQTPGEGCVHADLRCTLEDRCWAAR